MPVPFSSSKDYETYGDACDRIVSRGENDSGGILTLQRVLRRFERHSPVLNLHVGGKIIGTTAEHPFHVRDRGWTNAFELLIGDEIELMSGGWIAVDGIAESGRFETVFNLEVEGDHTYFVGCDEWGFSVWAHNATYTSAQIEEFATKYAAVRNKPTFTWEGFAKELGQDLSTFTSTVRSSIRNQAKSMNLVKSASVDAKGIADFSQSRINVVSKTGVDHGSSVFVKETIDLKYGSHFGHLDSKFVRPDTHVWDHMPFDGTFQLVERRVHATTQHKGYEHWTTKME